MFTIIIDGGLGRTICSIPALETFITNNPETYVISYWPAVYNCNKIIQPRSYDPDSKGLFDLVKNTKIIKPEPYYEKVYNYQKSHIISSFNHILNDNNELTIPKIILSHNEYLTSSQKFDRSKKTIVFQPFGSTASFGDDVFDTSVRSLNKDNTLQIVDRLRRENVNIMLMEHRHVPFIDYGKIVNVGNLHYREWFGLIACCDYFIGVDSSGQHIARSFNVPGTVFIGGTCASNITYEDFFRVVYKEGEKQYMPYRFCERDYREAETANWDLIHFSKQEIDLVCDEILNDIFKGSK